MHGLDISEVYSTENLHHIPHSSNILNKSMQSFPCPSAISYMELIEIWKQYISATLKNFSTMDAYSW